MSKVIGVHFQERAALQNKRGQYHFREVHADFNLGQQVRNHRSVRLHTEVRLFLLLVQGVVVYSVIVAGTSGTYCGPRCLNAGVRIGNTFIDLWQRLGATESPTATGSALANPSGAFSWVGDVVSAKPRVALFNEK